MAYVTSHLYFGNTALVAVWRMGWGGVESQLLQRDCRKILQYLKVIVGEDQGGLEKSECIREICRR